MKKTNNKQKKIKMKLPKINKYTVIIKAEYDIDATNPDEALEFLLEEFDAENMSANNEFWDNAKVVRRK
jgi:hypothetical protein